MTTLNYMLVVNDGGELKQVLGVDLLKEIARPEVENEIENAINRILDARAIAEGTYDPSDNDTPIVVTMEQANG